MDYILELFETRKVEFKDDPVLGPCINSGWSKLVKYYEKTSDSPAYVAALVLNPAYKWEYIDKNWEQTWIQGAMESVAGLWKAKYRPSTTHINQIDTPGSTKVSNFNQWKQGKHVIKVCIYTDSQGFSHVYLEYQHQMETNTPAIYAFLLTMTLTTCVHGGSY